MADDIQQTDFLPLPEALPYVKVCGLRRFEDARLALDLGATFLGLILTTKSPRYLPLDQARALVTALRASQSEPIRFVGVFVDEPAEEIARAAAQLGLAAVQVHGDVSRLDGVLPRRIVIPAVGIRDAETGRALAEMPAGHQAVLADAFSATQHGGTGKVFEHRYVQPVFSARRVFLAGGLKPENIEEVVARLQPGPFPYAFDLASGVEESPGVKSHERLRDFFERFRRAFPGGDPT